jgi:hypothetical protein
MSGPAQASTYGTADFALGVTNGGPGPASNVQLQTATPVKTTFVAIAAPAGWGCTAPAAGATGAVTCTTGTLAASATANFTMTVKVDACAGNGGVLDGSATVSSATSDPNPANNAPTAATTIVDNGACDDGNACTAGDACAAGVCSPGTAVVAPTETESLAAEGDKATFDWSAAPGATHYDVARGALGAFPVGSGGNEVCFDDLAGTTLVDPAIPDPGAGFWYLSRGENACGIGTFGNQSGGSPRVATACP